MTFLIKKPKTCCGSYRGPIVPRWHPLKRFLLDATSFFPFQRLVDNMPSARSLCRTTHGVASDILLYVTIIIIVFFGRICVFLEISQNIQGWCIVGLQSFFFFFLFVGGGYWKKHKSKRITIFHTNMRQSDIEFKMNIILRYHSVLTLCVSAWGGGRRHIARLFTVFSSCKSSHFNS